MEKVGVGVRLTSGGEKETHLPVGSPLIPTAGSFIHHQQPRAQYSNHLMSTDYDAHEIMSI